MRRIVVAVSGGADSLYALVTLQEQGHEVIALHGLFLQEKNTNAETNAGLNTLEKLCTQRKIPLHIIDYRPLFDAKVITPFLQEYALGRTPNPCAVCNANIKFGALMDSAIELGAQLFATGHYATINPLFSRETQNISPLCKGEDLSKDQSYFLALVPKERFTQLLFPLAHTQKQNNIQYLNDKNIPIPIAKESQEICFVPPTESSAYRDFVLEEARKRHIKLSKSGAMYCLEHGQEILIAPKQGGRHHGLWQYTEGQRRGLGVAWKEPLYVYAKDAQRNALILTNKNEAKLTACVVNKLNFFVKPEHWCHQELFVRLRYRQIEAPAHVKLDGDSLRITFQSPQCLTAPGQIAAVYSADGQVLAGGIIENIM